MTSVDCCQSGPLIYFVQFRCLCEVKNAKNYSQYRSHDRKVVHNIIKYFSERKSMPICNITVTGTGRYIV